MKKSHTKRMLSANLRRIIAYVLALSMILIPVQFPSNARAEENADAVPPVYFVDDFQSGDYGNGVTYKWTNAAYSCTREDGQYIISSGPPDSAEKPGRYFNYSYLQATMYDPVAKTAKDLAASWQDYTVEADVTRLDTDGNEYAGLMGRVTVGESGQLNYYAFVIKKDRTILYKAYDDAEGAWKQDVVILQGGSSAAAGTQVHLKMELKGNHISCYANDSLVIEYTDVGEKGAPLTKGSVGMYVNSRGWRAAFDNFTVTHTGSSAVFFDNFADDRFIDGATYQWRTTETPVPQDVTYTWTESLGAGTTSKVESGEYKVAMAAAYSKNNSAILNGVSTDNTDVDASWTNYTVEADFKREGAKNTSDYIYLKGRLQSDGSCYAVRFNGRDYSLWKIAADGTESRIADHSTGLDGIYQGWIHIAMTFVDNVITVSYSYQQEGEEEQRNSYSYTDSDYSSGGVGLSFISGENTKLVAHVDNMKVTLADGTVVYTDGFDSPDPRAPEEALDVTYKLTEDFQTTSWGTAVSSLHDGIYTISMPTDRASNYIRLDGTADELDVDQTWEDYTVEVKLRRNTDKNYLAAGIIGRVQPYYQGNTLVGYTFYRIRSFANGTRIDKIYWNGTGIVKQEQVADLGGCKVANNEMRTLRVTFVRNTITVGIYDANNTLLSNGSYTDEGTYGSALLKGGVGLCTANSTYDAEWSVDFDDFKVTLADGTVAYSDGFASPATPEPVDVTYQWIPEYTSSNFVPTFGFENETYKISGSPRGTKFVWLNGTAGNIDVDQKWSNYTVEVKLCRNTDSTQNLFAGILGRVQPIYESGAQIGYAYYAVVCRIGRTEVWKCSCKNKTVTTEIVGQLNYGIPNNEMRTVKATFTGNVITVRIYKADGTQAGIDMVFRDETDAPLQTGGVGLYSPHHALDDSYSVTFDDFSVTLADGTTPVFTDDFSSDKFFAVGGAIVEDAYTPAPEAGDYDNAFDADGLTVADAYMPPVSTEGYINAFFNGGMTLEDAYIPKLPEHWSIEDGAYVKRDENSYPQIIQIAGAGTSYSQNWTDYGVETDFMLTADQSAASLILRYTDSGHYELRMDGSNIYLYQADDMANALQTAALPLSLNEWHFVRAELDGAVIKVYVDGTMVLQYDGAALSNGTVGLKAVSGVKFDNLTVYPLEAADSRRFGTFEFEVSAVDELLYTWNFDNTANWAVSDNMLIYGSETAAGTATLKSRTVAENYFAEVIATPMSSKAAFAVLGRASLDLSDYYNLSVDMENGISLTKTGEGSSVTPPLASLSKNELYQKYGVMLLPNEEYVLRMEMYESTIRCYINGVRVFHLQDNTLRSGVSGVCGFAGAAFRQLNTGVTYADPTLSIVDAQGNPVTGLTVYKGKVPDIKGLYLKVDYGTETPKMILLDTVLDDGVFDENAEGTQTFPVVYDGIRTDFTYSVIERTQEIDALNAELAALDLRNLTEAGVKGLALRFNDLSAAEKAGIDKQNKEKLAAAQQAIDVQKYPELKDYEIIFKDEFDTSASENAYTNLQTVTATRNTGYWYVENGALLQYSEDDSGRGFTLESGFALKNKNFKAKSVSVDVQVIDPDQWIGFSVNFGQDCEGYRFMVSDKTTGYGGNRIRLYNGDSQELAGVVEAEESKWFKPGEWINLRMVFGDDGKIRCYVNDEMYIETEDKLTTRHDEALTSGTVMLYSAEGWGRFDNLVVYGEELPYEEIPKINTDLKPGEYTDDFEDEAAGKSPSHWIELNTEDDWLVKADGNGKVYGSTGHTADSSETWLHVFETNMDYSAKLRVTEKGYYPTIALTARMNAKASYIRAGYDFTLQKWFVKYRLAENFNEVAIYAENTDPDVDFDDWVNVRMVLNGAKLELYRNGAKVLTADVGTKIGPGRVGVYTERCNIDIDDVNLILTSGQGQVQDGVLEYYTDPLDIPFNMGSVLEIPDTNGDNINELLYYSYSDKAVSYDNGQTFTPTKDFSSWKTQTTTRLHNGYYVTVMQSGSNITAYVSMDNGATWSEGSSLPTENYSYAQPTGHINEVKLANGKYRLFFTAPRNQGESAGTYARIFYSDDSGLTWNISETGAEDYVNLGVFCETYVVSVTKDTTLASGKVIPAGTLVHYTSYNSSTTMRYTLSFDGGITWEGDYALPQIVCPRGSCAIREDPYNPGTYYMMTLYTHPFSANNRNWRNRNALFRSYDGINWEFLCDVDRWGDCGDGGHGQLLDSTNAYIDITKDYVFVNFGRNEEWQDGDNIVYGRIYRFEKDKLVDHDIPEEYIIQDKAITYIEGVEQDVPLNSATYAEDVTFTVYYYDGTSEKVALKEAFVSDIDMTALGKQTVVADYKHFRSVFTVNVVKGDVPALNIADGKTYCGAQTVTVTDANNDLASVTLNGNAVALTDGKFTVSVAEGQQTIVATDKAGNVTTIKITVNAGHTGGTATCTDKAECEACGEGYGELNADKHTKEVKWTIGADKHSKAYECCGKVVVTEAAHKGGTATCEDKAKCEVCNAEYGALAAHKGGEATCTDKAKCEVCGEGYGELNADKHTKDAKWATTADKHSKAYECCGKVVVAEEAHEWKDGKCEECGYEAELGTEQKPIEIPADEETVKEEAKVEAGEEKHYELDEKLAGKVITVKGEGAFVIVDGKKYEAKNGIVEVKLPTKTGKISVIIGNAGTKAGSFSITIATPSEDNSDTGDNAAIVLFGSLMALSVLAAGVLLIPNIRKKLMK